MCINLYQKISERGATLILKELRLNRIYKSTADYFVDLVYFGRNNIAADNGEIHVYQTFKLSVVYF